MFTRASRGLANRGLRNCSVRGRVLSRQLIRDMSNYVTRSFSFAPSQWPASRNGAVKRPPSLSPPLIMHFLAFIFLSILSSRNFSHHLLRDSVCRFYHATYKIRRTRLVGDARWLTSASSPLFFPLHFFFISCYILLYHCIRRGVDHATREKVLGTYPVGDAPRHARIRHRRSVS